MKKVIFFIALILFSCGPASAFAGGDGSAGNPYQISNVDELQAMSSSLSSHYILINDIDASETSTWNSGAGFDPVGFSYDDGFKGGFDGQNYTIRDLYIYRPTENYNGLFGYASTGSFFENLRFENCHITGGNYNGVLAGKKYTSTTPSPITNIIVTDSVVNGAFENGGLIGELESYSSTVTVEYVFIDCEVIGGNVNGGIIGYFYQRTQNGVMIFKNSHSVGDVSGNNDVGGIIGALSSTINNQITIQNIYSSGNVTGTSDVGGSIGSALGAYTIISTYYDSDVSGLSDTGKGTPKTTAEMKTESTYVGWDFENLWVINDAVNNGYPVIGYQTEFPLTLNLISPLNDTVTNSNVMTYELSKYAWMEITVDGNFDVGHYQFAGTQTRTLSYLTEGTHTWSMMANPYRSSYVGEEWVYTPTETFVYDITSPAIIQAYMTPDYDVITKNSTVNMFVQFSDANMDRIDYYLDDGSGYELENTIYNNLYDLNFDTGLYDVGDNISIKMIGIDKANNSQEYVQNFSISDDRIDIIIYDETSGEMIRPDTIRIYNKNTSDYASVNDSTNISTLSYGASGLLDGKYIIEIKKEGYYSRTSIIDVDTAVHSILNMFLPSVNETVIYDTFRIYDTTSSLDYDNYILRLDKPMTNGTETVYSSYFDYQGTTATYLIANDKYLLYVITPEKTISYGWLTPDVDGEVLITVNSIDYGEMEDWIQYSYSESDESISFDYTSSETIQSANFIVTKNGTESYNVSASTDTGSFTYSIDGDGIYGVHIIVESESGFQYIRNSVIEIGDVQLQDIDLFPESYSLLLKSIIVYVLIMAGALASSSYRTDMAAAWIAVSYGFATWQEWCYGNLVTVSLIGLMAIIVIARFQKKNSRSVY